VTNEIRLLRSAQTVFLLTCLFLFYSAINEYQGSKLVYIVFTGLSFTLLLFGFRRNAIFFDTFIGIFFWLGFWLKLSIRVAFTEGKFHESVGLFDGSGSSFDAALIASSVGFLGLLTASLIRSRFFFSYPQVHAGSSRQGLLRFYTECRPIILAAFVLLIALVAASNIYYGFYQRGTITRTILPYGLNGIYKWLLLFGLASVSAMILKFEYFDNRKTSYLVALIAILESFASNVSLLSRGMILNSSALGFGFYKTFASFRVKPRFRFLFICAVFLVAFFGTSVFIVNYARSSIYYAQSDPTELLERTARQSSILFLDRWVGIEGVLSVSSYPEKGWDLWRSALAEKYSENQLSFYDSHLISSPYAKVDKAKHHFVSLPGILAFFYYPGSLIFLYGCMLALGLFAFFVEFLAYRFGGKNLILCSLLAQVVAFRFASFGYVPQQSYLLFGAIFLNIGLIYLFNRLLSIWYERGRPPDHDQAT
jgi:hypothetical protein